MKWAVPVVFLVLLLPAALVGFGFDDEPPPARGGEVRFAVSSDVKRLDPQRSLALNDFRIIDNLFETLLRIDTQSLALVPAAAESLPDVSQDGLTYTFTLRADAKWSNGDAVTSHDFRFAWMRAMLPDLAADYSGKFFMIRGAKPFFDWRQQAISDFKANSQTAEQLWAATRKRFDTTVGISCPDDRTLIVELEKPITYFADLAAFGPFSPVHRATIELSQSLEADTGRMISDPQMFIDPEKMVSNGPYKLSAWAFNRHLIADANEHYWNRQAVQNGRFIMRKVSDPALQVMLYNSGELDWLPSVPTSSPLAAELVASGREDVHTSDAAGTYFYIFNCRPRLADGSRNPLADPRVRMALSMAIDRKLLVENVTRMNQTVGTSFSPPGLLAGYEAPISAGHGFDPSEARRLLKAAGYGPDRPLAVRVILNTNGGHENPAQAITQMWRDHLGVSATTQSVEWNTLIDLRKAGDFVISRGGWLGDYSEPSTFLELFKTGDKNNDAGYSNPAFDRLLTEAKTTLDPTRRMALYAQAETVVLRDAPVTPLYYYANLDIYDPQKMTGVELNPWRSPPIWKMKVQP